MGHDISYNLNSKNDYIRKIANNMNRSLIDPVPFAKEVESGLLRDNHLYDLLLMNEELYRQNVETIKRLKESCNVLQKD